MRWSAPDETVDQVVVHGKQMGAVGTALGCVLLIASNAETTSRVRLSRSNQSYTYTTKSKGETRMKPNEFFDNMYTACCEWQERSTAHKQQKQELLKTYGWNSPELEAWEAKEEEFPYSQGAVKAMQAYRSTEGDELIVEDHFWETETTDFIDTLRKAGIHSFVTTNQSTALMRNIHGFAAEGCTMQGLCTITKKSRCFGEETEETILGIRFTT